MACNNCNWFFFSCVLTTAVVNAVVYPGAEWENRSPSSVNMNATQLKLISNIGGWGCVVRDGYMVYSWGNQSHSYDIASAAKPIYSFFLLKAYQNGLIPSLNQKVSIWEPRLKEINANLSYKDSNITWHHMSNQISDYEVSDIPGSSFDYNDWQMALFWDTLFLKVYQTNYSNVDSLVLHPMLTNILQMEDYVTFMAFGVNDRPGRVSISPRDFARFGWLYLQNCKWKNNIQLLNQSLCNMAVHSALPSTFPMTKNISAEMIPGQRSIGSTRIPDDQTDHLGSYSWLWWTNGIDRYGNRHWPSAPNDTYGALGHFGAQEMYVIPSLNIIISWNSANIHNTSQENEALAIVVNSVIS